MERRREQNRAAQRRFRQRQKSAAFAVKAQGPPVTDPSLVLSPTSGFPAQVQQNRQSLTPDNTAPSLPSARFSGTPISPTPVKTPRSCSSFSFYGANLLLDNIEQVDMSDDDRIDISQRVLQLLPEGKETEKDPSRPAGQQHQPKESDASISSREDGTTNPKTKGWLTPLHVAAQKGRENIVHILLQHNADCNAKDSDGLTPLVHATIGGHKEVVLLLLNHGARISEVDDQCQTVLHWAAKRQREGVLKVLLEHCGREHAVIDRYDSTGRAPVHIAVETDFEEGLQLLLQFGADVHSKVTKDISGL